MHVLSDTLFWAKVAAVAAAGVMTGAALLWCGLTLGRWILWVWRDGGDL